MRFATNLEELRQTVNSLRLQADCLRDANDRLRRSANSLSATNQNASQALSAQLQLSNSILTVDNYIKKVDYWGILFEGALRLEKSGPLVSGIPSTLENAGPTAYKTYEEYAKFKEQWYGKLAESAWEAKGEILYTVKNWDLAKADKTFRKETRTAFARFFQGDFTTARNNFERATNRIPASVSEKAEAAAKDSKFGKVLGAADTVMTVAGLGFAAAKTVETGDYTYLTKEVGKDVGAAVGQKVGQVAGAALFSFIPIPGSTIVGGIVGGIAGNWLGGIAGEWVGGKVGEWLNNNPEARAAIDKAKEISQKAWDAGKEAVGKAWDAGTKAVGDFAKGAGDVLGKLKFW